MKLKMKTEIYSILLITFWPLQDANCLILNVIPTRIEPGTTDNLVVNCTLNLDTTPAIAVLNSLVLSRSVNQVVALISAVGGPVTVNDEDAVGSGVVSSRGESYLSVQWAYPVSDMAGTYICEAKGMSSSGTPQIYTVVAQVSSSAVSQKTIIKQLRSVKLENIQRIEEIKKLTEKLYFLEDNVTTSTNFMNKLKDENKEALITLFYESSVYSGRRYYLSKESALLTHTSALVTCAKYGGYLAEIDDDTELNFVREFLRNHTSFSDIIISGSDEEHEGLWTHARNNRQLNYFKWYRLDPNGGRSANCLSLWRDGNWYFADIACVVFGTGLYYSYLCEIQQQ